MNVLIAPDKFKGTLTATDVCRHISAGLQNRLMEVKRVPLADGGDGALDIFIKYANAELVEIVVHDPLLRPIKSSYAISQDGNTAFVEMAKASGLTLLSEAERNPMDTTSFGTGELIKHALDRGANHIVMALGGSATNDAALGAAEALGYVFTDRNGTKLSITGSNLSHVFAIDSTAIHTRLKTTKFTALCDVANPFYGPQGAAYIFSSQKGATPDDVVALDEGLRHIADIFAAHFGKVVRDIPGSGAAGGFAGGSIAMFNATLSPGFAFIADTTRLEEAIEWSDVVITGEGLLDLQTLHGKVVHGVCEICKQRGKPVIAVCGDHSLTHSQIEQLGLSAVYSMTAFAGIDRSLKDAGDVLETLTKHVIYSDLIKYYG
jgi:glycerate 2-kinase